MLAVAWELWDMDQPCYPIVDRTEGRENKFWLRKRKGSPGFASAIALDKLPATVQFNFCDGCR